MATVTEQEFLSQLYLIQSQNPPSTARLPYAEKVYDIDLYTRKIDSPNFVSVNRDHASETIYFSMDRFHDYMDMANTTCIIQYNTPKPENKTYYYIVPFFDIVTDRKNKKMIFPWNIEHMATKTAGTIEFSIRFFAIEKEYKNVTDYVDVEENPNTPMEYDYKLVYNLETLPAQTKILKSLEVSEDISDAFDLEPTYLEQLLAEVNRAKREGVYWTIYE